LFADPAAWCYTSLGRAIQPATAEWRDGPGLAGA